MIERVERRRRRETPPRPCHDRDLDRGMGLEHALHRRPNASGLRPRERLSHASDRRVVQHLAIGADDAREALADEVAHVAGRPSGVGHE